MPDETKDQSAPAPRRAFGAAARQQAAEETKTNPSRLVGAEPTKPTQPTEPPAPSPDPADAGPVGPTPTSGVEAKPRPQFDSPDASGAGIKYTGGETTLSKGQTYQVRTGLSHSEWWERKYSTKHQKLYIEGTVEQVLGRHHDDSSMRNHYLVMEWLDRGSMVPRGHPILKPGSQLYVAQAYAGNELSHRVLVHPYEVEPVPAKE